MSTPDLNLSTLDTSTIGYAILIVIVTTLALAVVHAYRLRPKTAPRGRRAQHPVEPSAAVSSALTICITIGAISTGILLAVLVTALMV